MRRVVDGEQLVGAAAGVHRRADPLDLVQHVLALVVAGQHDRDERPAGVVGRRLGLGAVVGRGHRGQHGGGVVGQGGVLAHVAGHPTGGAPLPRTAATGSSPPRRRPGWSIPVSLVILTRPLLPTRTTTRFVVVRKAGTDRSANDGRLGAVRPRGDRGPAGRVPRSEVHHHGPDTGGRGLPLAGDLDGTGPCRRPPWLSRAPTPVRVSRTRAVLPRLEQPPVHDAGGCPPADDVDDHVGGHRVRGQLEGAVLQPHHRAVPDQRARGERHRRVLPVTAAGLRGQGAGAGRRHRGDVEHDAGHGGRGDPRRAPAWSPPGRPPAPGCPPGPCASRRAAASSSGRYSCPPASG